MPDAPVLHNETFAYHSSVDGTGPLYADIAFIPDGKLKPLLVVMHGYHNPRQAVALDVQQLAALGVVALAPDMRGQGDSAGRFDSGAVEIHDIVDAISHAVSAYKGVVDPDNINLVGYSGGGANALSVATKFPDLLRVAVSFFGISDYALWYETKGRPDCSEIMVRTVGGTPDEVPARYEARNTLLAAGNNGLTRIHLFWDAEETGCPPILDTEFIAASRAAGHDNLVIHETQPGDAVRWIHNYRAHELQLQHGDALFVPEILAGTTPPPKLPPKGELVAAGYVVTKAFSVWVGDGTEGWVRVAYDLTGAEAKVEVVENPRGCEVRVEASRSWSL